MPSIFFPRLANAHSQNWTNSSKLWKNPIYTKNSTRHLLFLRDMLTLTASMGNDIVSPAQPSSPSHLCYKEE